MIIINGLPLPPSINQSYATNFKTRRRFKSKDLTNFEKLIANYWLERNLQLQENRKIIESWIKEKRDLSFTCIFYLDHKRIFTSDMRKKKMDVSNRIKAIEDSIVGWLWYDDCHHTKVMAIKTPTPNESESVTVKIEPFSWS